MIEFDTTVGGASANSYATVAEFTAYTEKLVNSEDIPKSSQTTLIKKLLIAATETVDVELAHSSGTVPTVTQRLEWPRSGTYDRRGVSISDDVLPQELKDAVSEMAIWLFQNNVNHTQSDNWGDEPESASLGGAMTLEYTIGRKPSNMIPSRVKFLLSYIVYAYVPQTEKRRV